MSTSVPRASTTSRLLNSVKITDIEQAVANLYSLLARWIPDEVARNHPETTLLVDHSRIVCSDIVKTLEFLRKAAQDGFSVTVEGAEIVAVYAGKPARDIQYHARQMEKKINEGGQVTQAAVAKVEKLYSALEKFDGYSRATQELINRKVDKITELGETRQNIEVSANAVRSLVQNSGGDNPLNFATMLIVAPLIGVGANMLSNTMRAKKRDGAKEAEGLQTLTLQLSAFAKEISQVHRLIAPLHNWWLQASFISVSIRDQLLEGNTLLHIPEGDKAIMLSFWTSAQQTFESLIPALDNLIEGAPYRDSLLAIGTRQGDQPFTVEMRELAKRLEVYRVALGSIVEKDDLFRTSIGDEYIEKRKSLADAVIGQMRILQESSRYWLRCINPQVAPVRDKRLKWVKQHMDSMDTVTLKIVRLVVQLEFLVCQARNSTPFKDKFQRAMKYRFTRNKTKALTTEEAVDGVTEALRKIGEAILGVRQFATSFHTALLVFEPPTPGTKVLQLGPEIVYVYAVDADVMAEVDAKMRSVIDSASLLTDMKTES